MSNYFYSMTAGIYSMKSVVGALLFFLIAFQCLSGFFLALAYIPDSMLYPISREFDDMEDLYSDDIFWLHERGVDFIFIFLFFHIFRKIFIANSHSQFNAWSTGAFLMILVHLSVFFGLSLCGTHLSEVTLLIAANLLSAAMLRLNNAAWFLFTDLSLNLDVLLRLSVLHYLISFFLLFFCFLHLVDMHYDWKDASYFSGNIFGVLWSSVVLKYEFYSILFIFNFFFFFYFFTSELNEAVSYEIFMWGDVGIVNDVRYFGVAPHWYFRAYMGWLNVCPSFYVGIFGLAFFILCLALQNWLKRGQYLYLSQACLFTSPHFNIAYVTFYTFFVLSSFYTFSILPYGRFYNRLGGNVSLLFSYFFILLYLSNAHTYIFLSIYFSFNRNYVVFFRS